MVQTVSVTGTSTITTTFGYDPDGNTLSQTTQTQDATQPGVQTHTLTSTVNAADWTTSTSADGYPTTYGYDAAGQERTQTVLTGTALLTSTLDAAGRQTALSESVGGSTTYTSTFAYNPNDLPVTITLPGGVQETAQYDANSRLVSWHDPGPGQNVTYSYGYNAVGWLTSASAVSGTDTITHDAQGRIVAESGPQVVTPNQTYGWGYDGNGNIVTATADSGGPITYTYASGTALPNELQTVTGPYANPVTYYSYDGAGNTTIITSPVNGSLTAPGAINTHLVYDAASRPLTVTLKDGSTIVLSYNAAGERASYTVTNGAGQQTLSEQFIYRDGQVGQTSVVSATTGGSISYVDTFLYTQSGLPLELIRQQGGVTSRYWYELDGRGNVVALTDVSGAVVDRYEYDQWGEELPYTAIEGVRQPLRAQGYWWDRELELAWDGSRYYDPQLMRYLQPAAPGGSYVFTGDDPNYPTTGVGGLAPHANRLGPDYRAREAARHIAGFNDYGKLEYSPPVDGCPGGLEARILPGDIGGHTNPAPEAGELHGVEYDAGHLLGANLGGSNTDPENFVAQTVKANRSSFKRVENLVRRVTRRGYGVDIVVRMFWTAGGVARYSPHR